jgi:DNA-binding response OmpR family regulator
MILIVEDDLSARKALPALLEAEGFTCVFAASLKDALTFIKNKTPDFVILDMMLPDGSGLDILTYIQENNLPTRCIVVTGSPDACTQDLGYPVLTKPVDFDELVAMLQQGSC